MERILLVLVIRTDVRAAAGIGFQGALCASLYRHRKLPDLLHTNAVQALSRTLWDIITLALGTSLLLCHCLVVQHEYKAVGRVKAAAMAHSDVAAVCTPCRKKRPLSGGVCSCPAATPRRGRELSP